MKGVNTEITKKWLYLRGHFGWFNQLKSQYFVIQYSMFKEKML